MARWHEQLQDYDFRIIHIAGKINTPTDALSRPPGSEVAEDSRKVALLPPEVFLNVFGADSDGSLEHQIVLTQRTVSNVMEQWAKDLPIVQDEQVDGPIWRHVPSGRLVVPPVDKIRKKIVRVWHDSGAGGHLGRDETTRKVQREYLWPKARLWIAQYVKGCTVCQQNKNLTHQPQTLLFKIPVPENAPSFTQVAMDLITRLPKSQGYDTILTIVDHGCTRGTLFLPCHMTITGPQIAKLYYQHVYLWFGLPKKLISNIDPRFTSHFGKALAKELGITWNLLTAYHPQTDGLTEQKNQWVEQYLRLVMTNQADWATMLPLATLVHNNMRNGTTGFPSNDLLIGLEPPATPEQAEGGNNPLAEQQVSQLREQRMLATQALNWVARQATPTEA